MSKPKLKNSTSLARQYRPTEMGSFHLRTAHSVSGEIQGVDLRLGQVVLTSHVLLRLRKSDGDRGSASVCVVGSVGSPPVAGLSPSTRCPAEGASLRCAKAPWRRCSAEPHSGFWPARRLKAGSRFCGVPRVAYRLINAGISAETLKVVLRHKDFNTTERFCGASRAAQAAAIENHEKLKLESENGSIEVPANSAPLSSRELQKLKRLLRSL